MRSCDSSKPPNNDSTETLDIVTGRRNSATKIVFRLYVTCDIYVHYLARSTEMALRQDSRFVGIARREALKPCGADHEAARSRPPCHPGETLFPGRPSRLVFGGHFIVAPCLDSLE